MAKQRFQLYNIMHGDSISIIEMDDSLLAEEAGIVDQATMSLRKIKNGSVYTLLPLEDHTVATLKRVKAVYKHITEKPAKLFSASISRMDELIQAVDLLFGEIEYVVVEGIDDLHNLINPTNNDWTPKKVKYSILGDLLKDAESNEEKSDES